MNCVDNEDFGKALRARQEAWDLRFLELARHVAGWSKDPSTKVGAVIVDSRRRVLGLGYNGFPRGVEDTPERLDHRPTKYSLVVHAEVNAILNAGRPVEGATLYGTLFCCNECAKVIIQAGIRRVVTPPFVTNGRWDSPHAIAESMLREAGVTVGFIG